MPCTPERGVDAPDALPPVYWLPFIPLPVRRGVDTSPLPVRRGVDAPEAGCPEVDGRRGVDAPDAEAETRSQESENIVRVLAVADFASFWLRPVHFAPAHSSYAARHHRQGAARFVPLSDWSNDLLF